MCHFAGPAKPCLGTVLHGDSDAGRLQGVFAVVKITSLSLGRGALIPDSRCLQDTPSEFLGKLVTWTTCHRSPGARQVPGSGLWSQIAQVGRCWEWTDHVMSTSPTAGVQLLSASGLGLEKRFHLVL